MEAQDFFTMCNTVIKNASIARVTAFQDCAEVQGDPIYDDFFMDEPESAAEEVPVTSIKSVIVEVIPQIHVDDQSIYDYYFSYLDLDGRSVIEGDVLHTWNVNFVKQLGSDEEALREFILMHFGVCVVGGSLEEFKQLKVGLFKSCGELPNFVELEDISRYARMKEEGFDPFQVSVLSEFADISEIKSLMGLESYCFEEAKEFCRDETMFSLYLQVKLEDVFDRNQFLSVLGTCKAEDFFRVYSSDFVEYKQIVAGRSDVNNQLLQQAIFSKCITKEWLTEYGSSSILNGLLEARVKGIGLEWFEQMSNREVIPSWLMKMYQGNALVGVDGSRLWLELVEKDIARYLGKEVVLQDSAGAERLYRASKANFILPDEYRKYLLLVSEDAQLLRHLGKEVLPFNRYWFEDMLRMVEVACAVPNNVGSAWIVLDMPGRVKILDVFQYALNKKQYAKRFEGAGFNAALLDDRAGVVLYKEEFRDSVRRVVSYKNASLSSVEYWASNPAVVQKGLKDVEDFDIYRINLLRLLERVGSSGRNTKLQKYLHCNLQQYLIFDRCFNYVLDVMPELLPVACTEYVDVLLSSILMHPVDSLPKFTLLFLRDIMRGIKKLELRDCSKLGALNQVHFVYGSFDRNISFTSLYSGFSGFMQLAESADKVVLGVVNGNVFLKIIKKM